MPLRAGGSGEKKATLIATSPSGLLRQFHREGAHRQGNAYQRQRARFVMQEKEIETDTGRRPVHGRLQMGGVSRLVSDLPVLCSCRLQPNFVRRTEEHRLLRRNAALA